MKTNKTIKESSDKEQHKIVDDGTTYTTEDKIGCNGRCPCVYFMKYKRCRGGKDV